MKKDFFISLLFGFLSANLFAQKAERVIGIYKSASDFTFGKLSYLMNCDSKKNIIRLDNLFNKPYITIQQNNSSYKILKKTLYGYKTCNNQLYIFYKRKELLLLNQGEEIMLYKNLYTKIHEGSRINVTNKYFSVGVNNSVQLLTIKNLKNAFPGNLKFQSLIDKNFKYNMDLGTVDSGGTFKINSLLKQSRQ